MAIKRKVTAEWKGKGTEGSGSLNSSNQFFNNTPYSFKGRFENEDGKLGTNPEELIAAAHSGCYAMALSIAVAKAGFTPDLLKVEAVVTLDQTDGGFSITGIQLNLEAKVPGITAAQFDELANGAKAGCPVSKALAATPITLSIQFTA